MTRGLWAVLGAFGAIVGVDILVHQVWLGDFYQAHAAWWRPAADMQRLMPFMYVGQFVKALLLTAVYIRGFQPERGTVAQGIRFGLIIGLLLYLPCSFMTAVIYPYPSALIASWLAGGMLQTVLAGAVLGALYRRAGY